MNNYLSPLSLARRRANSLYDTTKSRAALDTLIKTDPVVAEFLIKAFKKDYKEVEFLAIWEWRGDMAAQALDATTLEDEDYTLPEGKTWEDIYNAIAKAYNIVQYSR